MDDGTALICWTVFVAALAASASYQMASNEYKQQAVEHQCGHWETATDGKTKFIWNGEVKK